MPSSPPLRRGSVHRESVGVELNLLGSVPVVFDGPADVWERSAQVVPTRDELDRLVDAYSRDDLDALETAVLARACGDDDVRTSRDSLVQRLLRARSREEDSV